VSTKTRTTMAVTVTAALVLTAGVAVPANAAQPAPTTSGFAKELTSAPSYSSNQTLIYTILTNEPLVLGMEYEAYSTWQRGHRRRPTTSCSAADPPS
jgi:hypothetical protein